MSEYERLTSYMQVGNEVVQIVPQRKQRIQAYIDRLFDLEDKIEGGELISKEQFEQLQSENAALRERLDKAGKFPCKVGDIIYQTDTNGTRIFKNTVKNIIFETDGVAFDERAIGESIFLTEEAVKEKMKKLQEKRQ